MKLTSTILVFLTTLAVFEAQGQSISGGCNAVYIGDECVYTISPPSGESVRSYRLDGFPQFVSIRTLSATNTKTYTTIWDSAGSFVLCLRKPGDPCESQTTITVYAKIEQVTISGPSGNQCPSVITSTYSASAPNAAYYSWSLNPSDAGTISSGVVTWSSSFQGSASVRVNAYDEKGGSTRASLEVSRLAGQTFTASINAPSVVCEGDQFQIGVVSSHSSATYAWYEDDGQNSIGSSSFLSVTPQVGTFYRVVVTPGASITCLTNPGAISLRTRVGSFRVRPKVNSLTVSTPITARCSTDATNTSFLATANEVDSYTWSIEPSNAAQLTAQEDIIQGVRTSSCTVVWNSVFSGMATIRVQAFGCGASVDVVTKNVRVTKPPFPVALSDLPVTLCENADQVVNLVSSEVNVNYELAVEGALSGMIQKLSASSWKIKGPGLYTVVASDIYLDCPSVFSPPQNVLPNISNIEIITNLGSLVQKNGDLILTGCFYIDHTLTISGDAHSYQWYNFYDTNSACECRAKGNCRKYWGILSPEKTEKEWEKLCLKLSNESKSVRVAPGWARKLLVRYKDVCNLTREHTIYIRGLEQTMVKGITPEFYERKQGAETTEYKMDYTGPLHGLRWEISPTQAGDISPEGVLTWNPSWHSFLNSEQQEVVVSAWVKTCSNVWEPYSQNIIVYPGLDTKENRVREYVTQQPFSQYSGVRAAIDDPFKVQVRAGYFDGLGRNIQNVQYFGATVSKDLIELKTFDEFGREAIKNLPYAYLHSLEYPSNSLEEQPRFYKTPPVYVMTDNFPFSKDVYEPSPLNRVVKQGAPGAPWQPNPDPFSLADNTVKKRYEFNGENEVIIFSYDPTTQLVTKGLYYAPNQLYANKTIDEQNHEVIEYVDKEGRTVCKKVEASGSNGKTYASTYYVYDDLGNLAVVLPPEGLLALTKP